MFKNCSKKSNLQLLELQKKPIGKKICKKNFQFTFQDHQILSNYQEEFDENIIQTTQEKIFWRPIASLIALILMLLLNSPMLMAQDLAQENLVIWNSKQGLERLERSKHKNDFYQMANFFQPQINPLYCGIATSVMLLNALKEGEIENQRELAVLKPQALGGGVAEFHSYSQINFLNDKTDKIKKREIIEMKQAKVAKGKEIYDPGLTLDELAKILGKVHKLQVQKVHVRNSNRKALEKFREILRTNLVDDKNFVVVNFDGKVIGAGSRGHISPVAAYDEQSDSVLILDVALHKNNWYFADLSKLYEAMNTKDGKDYRGYLIVAK